MNTRRNFMRGLTGIGAIVATGHAPAIVKSMIAARGTMLGGAHGFTNPYMTDGLVAMWDGEWNAGGGVHDPNATSIVDLVGGCGNLELNKSNNAVYNHAYIGDNFIGNDNYTNNYFAHLTGSIEASQTILGLASGYTFEYCAETTGQSFVIWNNPIIRTSGSSSTGDVLGYQPIGGRIGGLGMFGNGMYYGTTSIHGTYDFVGTNSSVTCHVNTVPKGTNSMSSSGAAVNLVIGVCKALYSVRLYSRALTADEIAANYAVDKKRFNLASYELANG